MMMVIPAVAVAVTVAVAVVVAVGVLLLHIPHLPGEKLGSIQLQNRNFEVIPCDSKVQRYDRGVRFLSFFGLR